MFATDIFPTFRSNDTQYAEVNGGDWNFIVEDINKISVPQDEVRHFLFSLTSVQIDWILVFHFN